MAHERISTARFQWLLPLLTSVFGVYLLFFWAPYATGYGEKPVPLWTVARTMWFGFPDWTYGIFIFPVAAGLIYWKRRELQQIPVRGSWLGLPIFALALVVYWCGYAMDLQYVGFLAVQLFVAALVLWFLGRQFFGALFFIWLFLTLGWPFVFLDQYVAFPLRLLMSEGSGKFLNLIGVATLQQGTAILSAPNPLKGIRAGARFAVDIADPCSGIHSLFALATISAFYGIAVLRRWWQIIIVFLAAFPLAIFGNFCRIIILAFGTLWFGSSFAIGTEEQPSWFHLGAGYFVYVAALAGILLIGRILRENRKEVESVANNQERA